MSSGLEWIESYTPFDLVPRMLFVEEDAAKFASNSILKHPIGAYHPPNSIN
jgi:hypothetical protein